MLGGRILHDSLVENGVEHVFGYSGGANLPVLDAFHKSPIKFVMNRSEQCCGHAAEGYAKASGRPGVILTTSGPGLTNIITPLQDAKGDSVPMVALSGQVPTHAVGTDAFQECASVDLTRPCTKWSYQIRSVEEIRSVVHEAFAVAMTGKRGPVHLDLPKDVMVALLHGDELPVSVPPPRSAIDPSNLADIARLMNIAERPILYVGQGAIDCAPTLRAFAAASNIPVTTTLHAMGIFDEHHPSSMHMLGMHGAAYANYAIQNADLILAVGSRFDDRTTGVLSKYAPAAKAAEREGRGGIVHFDIERTQIGRVVSTTHAVEGDCQLAMEALMPMLERRPRDAWHTQLAAWKVAHPFAYTRAGNGVIKTQQVIEMMYNVTKGKRQEELVVSTGVGNHQMMAAQFYRWSQPRSIVTSGSLGTMGFGLPAAIGAQFSRPNATVVLIDGDSSFNMTLNDLGTVAEHKLPIKMFILNDGRQQMVHVWQKLFFDGRLVATNNVNPNFAMLARSYGIESWECSSEADLKGTVERMFAFDGPVLVDFKVQPDICLPMVAPGKALDDMFLPGDITLDDDRTLEGMAPN